MHPYNSMAEATITDPVTGRVMPVEFGHVQVIKSYSNAKDSFTESCPGVSLAGKVYDYNFIRFKTRVFKKYLKPGYPFKIVFTGSDRVVITSNGGLKELEGEIRFLESTGKRVPYSPRLLSVRTISNIEACERIERFST